jgi:hypothetical protein
LGGDPGAGVAERSAGPAREDHRALPLPRAQPGVYRHHDRQGEEDRAGSGTLSSSARTRTRIAALLCTQRCAAKEVLVSWLLAGRQYTCIYETKPLGRKKGLTAFVLPPVVLLGIDDTGAQLFDGATKNAIDGEGYPYHLIRSWSWHQPKDSPWHVVLTFGDDQKGYRLELATEMGKEICARVPLPLIVATAGATAHQIGRHWLPRMLADSVTL